MPKPPDRRPAKARPGPTRPGPGARTGRPGPRSSRDNGPQRARSRGASGPQEFPEAAPVAAPSDERFIARGVRLVHEDDDLIVVDKPPGLVTADPSRAQFAAPNMRPSARVGQTLFDLVKRHVRSTARPRKRRIADGEPADAAGRVWVIHRLDKEASGLLVFAKSLRAFESLKAEFASKKAQRLYVAVAEGVMGEVGLTSTRQSIIADDFGPGSRGPRVGREGESSQPRPAVTHYRVMAVGKDRTLVHVRLETGRKNQIRIHMLELGHPLVGDARFNARTNPIKRLGLHAAELGFTHPGTNQSVRFSSPPPVSFYSCVGAKPPTGSLELEVVRTGRPPAMIDAGATAPADREDTSWDSVAQWYDKLLEDRGNDHYEQVILPGTLELLEPRAGQRVLDVACGQGIFSRRLMKLGLRVIGVDASAQLIEVAKARTAAVGAHPDSPGEASRSPLGSAEFHALDARDLASLSSKGPLDGAVCVMAIANMDPLEPVLNAIAGLLKPGAPLVLTLSHPAFRVPGASDWGWDDAQRRQYRRVDRYLSSSRREITMHPGKAALGEDQRTTPTFHRPLNVYVRALARAGMMVDRMEEWVSKREATSGPRAPEENRARVEIPLFLGVRAVKRSE